MVNKKRNNADMPVQTKASNSIKDKDSTDEEDGVPSLFIRRCRQKPQKKLECEPEPEPPCPPPAPSCGDECHEFSCSEKICCFLRSTEFCNILGAVSILLILFFLYQFGGMIARAILPSCWLKSTDQRIQEAIARYHADAIALPDHALETSGGSIICHSGSYYSHKGPLYSFFGIPVWYAASNPSDIIRPDVHPGKCWAMNGRSGFITVKLRGPVVVSAISLEHIPRAVAFSEDDHQAAVKEFVVVGKELDMSSPDVVLGRFNYRLRDKPIQQFCIKDPKCDSQPNKRIFRIVTLQVLSNHGNPDFTCIYRFRVHGREVKPNVPLIA